MPKATICSRFLLWCWLQLTDAVRSSAYQITVLAHQLRGSHDWNCSSLSQIRRLASLVGSLFVIRSQATLCINAAFTIAERLVSSASLIVCPLPHSSSAPSSLLSYAGPRAAYFLPSPTSPVPFYYVFHVIARIPPRFHATLDRPCPLGHGWELGSDSLPGLSNISSSLFGC